MPLRDNELARRTNAGLALRSEPLRIRWEFSDLVTNDGHELKCVFSCGVRPVADRLEQRMLEELLLDGKSVATVEDVARFFMPALRSAAARVARAEHSAAEWVEQEKPQRELIEALKTSAMPVAFSCGLEVLPPYHIELHSPTYERQRVRAMHQSLAEQEAASQVEHFQRAAGLLKEFQALRQQAPELSASEVLQRISPSDQGSVMQSLLMASARQLTRPPVLWAVAGPYLVKVEPSQPIDARTPLRPQLFPLSPALGPLRSVQMEQVDGKPTLLVGAQHGFLRIDVDHLSESTTYADPGFDSPLGFNRVVYWSGRRQFCATHSEAGIVCWDQDSPGKPASVLRSAALGMAPAPTPLPQDSSLTFVSMSMRVGSGVMGPRNLAKLNDSALAFTAAGKIMRWDGAVARTLAEPCGSEVVALRVEENGRTYSVHEDGSLCEMDWRTAQVISVEKRWGKVRSAAWLPWLGATRLLIAGDEGALQCVGLTDPMTMHYSSAHRGLRVIAGSAGFVAAVSGDRQRVVLWNIWDGRQAASEIFIGAAANHRIADIAVS